MTLRLYDSLSREVRAVEPRDPGRLAVYSCGPTVYSYIHVGNARPFWIAMLLRRHVRRSGVEPTVVVNVTDVNDKIYEAARAEGVPSDELARRYADAYLEDTSRLGLGRPDVEPLVTDTISDIVELIGTLIERGLAYAVDGDVYFAVERFPAYGRLSRQRLDQLLEEGRVEPGEGKRSPLDFALWKAEKPGEDTAWDAPWGRGRPGWHIECSAMARRHLGDDFDVHGGGLDLIFPHHENERAQSEGATERPFVRTWLHNGMLRFSGDKMSKSVGNVTRLRDALDAWGPETLLLLFAGAHYRGPVDYSDDTLTAARASAERLREVLRRARAHTSVTEPDRGDDALGAAAVSAGREFDAALDDDLSTPQALAALFGLVRVLNAALDEGGVSSQAVAGAADVLVDRLDVLGLAGLDAGGEPPVPEEVRRLADARQAARLERDFGRADELRDELAARGWSVRDTPRGPELVPR
ncbi:MAG: Cysteinyl-tRNA synthetase [uncultured Thermoleophilia bacterium]|uniref:Cysteine--tRNA ligase n=1 Tax=uncultured Thermoleophilia bacterium TaxID=1497501 RepID=A0A6J4U9B7_9ACTN|nr:MAG: Cysteinyl-tRNA synthetase [uncultured Thermoleophilia bacterium]